MLDHPVPRWRNCRARTVRELDLVLPVGGLCDMTESTVVGAAVIVYRQFQGNVDFLILHRSHSGPDFEGDWAWGPPSGRIGKGESAIECAIRELQEETGLALDLKETNYGPAEFVVFTAEAGGQEAVVLSDEHVVRYSFALAMSFGA